MFDRGQDGTVTVTLTSATDISAWAVSAVLRAYHGGTALATKTVGSGITSSYAGTTQTWVITFTDTDLEQEPGGYVWDFRRTDADNEYQIVEPSAFIIRADASSAYPTLTNLSEYQIHALGSPSSTTDANAKFRTQLLGAAEAMVRRYTGRKLTRASYTEYPVSSGTQAFQLREYPVNASSSTFSLYLDTGAAAGQNSNDFASSTLLTFGTDYYLDLSGSVDGESQTGLVYRIGTVWPGRMVRPVGGDGSLLSYRRQPWPGVLKVTYTAGYSLVPYDLKAAVWNIASQMAFMAPYGTIFTSESGEGRSYSRMTPDQEAQLFTGVQNILSRFRRGGLLVG